MALGDHEEPLEDNARLTEYHTKILMSFLFCAFLHHVISPLIFKRFNSAYRNLSKNKQMEWDSRVVSTLHATSVSILCVISLLKERQLWSKPFTAQGHIALNALCISIGYFLCDLISMPIYYKQKSLIIFSIHHFVAMSAFYLIVVSKFCLFFGIYRLTTEMSTPFTNQRWFYRTVGYTPDRRRVALVTLIFSILFAITRNFMVIPYWLLVYVIYGTPDHQAATAQVPMIEVPWYLSSLVLDGLNTYWALQVYPIGYKAAYMLYKADWRSDIDRARDRLRGRFLSARRRAMDTELIASLRRSASFNRLHRAFASGTRLWDDWSAFSEGLSEPEFDAMSSGQTTPLRRFSDSNSDEDSSNEAVADDGNNETYLDVINGDENVVFYRGKRTISSSYEH